MVVFVVVAVVLVVVVVVFFFLFPLVFSVVVVTVLSSFRVCVGYEMRIFAINRKLLVIAATTTYQTVQTSLE